MTDQHRISRQRFVAGAGVGLAGLALPSVGHAAIPTERAVYRLSPDGGICDGPGSACACAACYAHAEAMIFPSMKAADGNRAHAHCNCGIEEAGTLPFWKWIALFGTPHHISLYSADRRDRRVAAILNLPRSARP
jgi:hypothetical protein